MKFGKTEHIDQVDFSLPGHSKDLPRLPNRSGPCSLYIGGTGWSMKEWKGRYYPIQAKTGDYLYYYSRLFNSIEFNSTHYSLPSPSQILKWKEAVPEDFKFCPKVWKNISHRKTLGIDTNSIDQFSESVLLLDHNLGPCFMQLPPYFDFSRKDQLLKCIEKFPPDIQLHVEVRHPSFYEDQNFNEFRIELEKMNCGWVITDVAGRRDIVHTTLTLAATFIRWVGNGLHPTDYVRLEEWRQVISNWVDAGVTEIYFFPHQPDNLLTPEISSYFYNLISGLNVSGRGPILPNQNKQLSLF